MLNTLCRIAFLAVLATNTATAAEQQPPLLKVGFAEADITPEIGMEHPGGYGKLLHGKLHDPCKVRAVVFDDGKKRAALVGVDGIAVHRHMVQAARKKIEEKCGIPADAILIGASHSHSSGPLYGVLPGYFDDCSELVRTLAYEKSTCVNADYIKHVEKQIIAAVCKANETRQESLCGVGSGIEDKVAFNRRFRMKNGLSHTHPRPGNPDIIEPAGPIDPEVGVIGVWNKQNKLLGCVVNYACHCTTNPGGISANWVYYLEKTIRGALGEDAVVVFLAGASGDVTQVDNLAKHARLGGERGAHLVGGRIGAEAVKVLLKMDRGTLAPIDSRVKVWQSKRRVPKPERVKRCLEIVQMDPKKVDRVDWTFAKEIVLLDRILAKEPLKEVEVQAVQVGPAVFLTDMAEYFCQLGLDIKAGSPFPFTFPVSLANGCCGYVPTAEALGPKGGGYETRLTSYSNLEPAAGRTMADVAIELSKQLKPGPVPQPVQVRPFSGSGWTYGNVPPELD